MRCRDYKRRRFDTVVVVVCVCVYCLQEKSRVELELFKLFHNERDLTTLKEDLAGLQDSTEQQVHSWRFMKLQCFLSLLSCAANCMP